MERSLSSQAALLHAILETSVAAVCVVEPAGRIVFANQQAERILGLKPSDLVGVRYDAPEWRATAPDGGPWPREKHPLRQILRTGEPIADVQHAIEWPDGQRKVLSINGAPIKNGDGEITRLVFSVTDITDRKIAEMAQRQSEEAFRTVLETVPSYIVSVARDCSILFLNRTLPHLEMAEVIGRNVLEFMAEESRDAYREALERAFESGELQECEGLALQPDGPPTPFLLRFGPVRAQGGVESVTVVGIDISQIKEAERALEESREELQRVQRLDSIGRLAGGLAHDFNNLLTAILGCAELVRPALADRPEALDLVDQISDAGERGARLTRQLLTFASRQAVEPRIVEINDLIRGAESLLRRLIGEDVELHTDLEPRLWPIEVDPVQLERVLMNLTVNARDAMPEGGRLEIRTANETSAAGPAPEPRRGASAQWVLLEVKDDGCGMDEETARLAFEPFFTTKRGSRGTGLGLATCFGIVRQAGGMLDVASRPGEGSRFSVRLPRAPEGPSRSTRPPERP